MEDRLDPRIPKATNLIDLTNLDHEGRAIPVAVGNDPRANLSIVEGVAIHTGPRAVFSRTCRNKVEAWPMIYYDWRCSWLWLALPKTAETTSRLALAGQVPVLVGPPGPVEVGASRTRRRLIDLRTSPVDWRLPRTLLDAAR